MEIMLDILSWFFLVMGSFFCLTGGVGLLRFPDFYSRIHSASLTDTLGASLILIGLMFQAGWGIVSAKLVMILVFCGAGLISDDLKFNSLQLYFSRPITKRDYFLGKASVIVFFLFFVTTTKNGCTLLIDGY